ncbi:MAG: M48 family metallopeptidase [Magnetococcales bacterium]|nr:M48 family metallopeptidase [Magnetococcales bacterium]
MNLVAFDGREVPYTLIRVRSRKKMTVLVTPKGEVEVRVPVRVTLKQVDKFLKQCREWVIRRLNVVERQINARPALTQGVVIPFLDERLTLNFSSSRGRGIEKVDNDLYIPQIWSEDTDLLIQRLELWYSRQARKHFLARLNHFSKIMGVKYNRLSIRNQKTIWGSCSAKCNINLNWRLMWMPYNVADYVVIHELCHLDYMDHSPEFWQRVKQFSPNHRQLRSKLKDVQSPW